MSTKVNPSDSGSAPSGGGWHPGNYPRTYAEVVTARKAVFKFIGTTKGLAERFPSTFACPHPHVVSTAAGGRGDALQLLLATTRLKSMHPGRPLVLNVSRDAMPYVRLFTGWDELGETSRVHCEDTGDAHLQANLGYWWHETSGRPMGRATLYAENVGADGLEFPELRDPERVRAAGADLAGSVVIAPFSTDSARNWPLANWLEVERRLTSAGYQVVVVHGGRCLRTAASEVAAFRGQKLLNAPAERLAGCILNCAFLLGNDSGPAHMGGLLGAPVVVVGHGPVDNVFDCYPTVKCASRASIGSVTVDDVLESISSTLGGKS